MQHDYIELECGSVPIISGKAAFDVHTSHGLFIDIIEQMASEVGLKVDRAGYHKLFDEFQEKSGSGRKKFVITAIQGQLPKTDDSPKYPTLSAEAKIFGWVKDNAVITNGQLKKGDEAAILVDRTVFYAEQGGQVGDSGTITSKNLHFNVTDTQRLGDAVLHIGNVQAGTVSVGDNVWLQAGLFRVHTMKNHTATHLLNFALRQVLGDHIEQKGSLVDPEKTRFDFSHNKPLTADELRRVEEIVNQEIQADLPVTAVTMPLAEAKELPGVRAVFGEKYPDPVRVLMIGAEKPEQVTAELSVEFCGGTHLSRTSQAGIFKIIGQELVSKGVRRITAITGPKAVDFVQKMSVILDDLTRRFNCSTDDLPSRIESLQEEVKKLQKQLQKGVASDLNSVCDKLAEAAIVVGCSKLIVGEVPGAAMEQLRSQVDRIRQKVGSSLIVLGWKLDEGEGGGFLVGVTDDLVKKGIKAGDIVKQVAEIAGGKGGGPPNIATAGCKDTSRLAEALAKAIELGRSALSR